MKWCPVIAILCITSLLIVALCRGVNGALLASGFALIGGLGGYAGKSIRDKMKGG